MSDSNKKTSVILIVMLAILSSLTVFLLINSKPEYKVYDCRISEWHPDYPPKVKEECRKLQGKKVLTLGLNSNIII